MTRTRVVLAALVMGLGALATLGCTANTNVTLAQSEQTGITVSGTGRVTVVPDIGVLSLGVQATQPTVAAARNEAAKAMDAVRTSLKQNGVDDKDIATAGFNIQPQQDFRSGTPRITGYQVNNQVTVKVRQIDALSKTLDSAVAAGHDAVRVNGISFAVDKPERFEGEARDKAVADARTRAEQLAKAAGVKLGRARSVNESFGGRAPTPMRALAGAAVEDAVPTPLNPGESEITLTVNIVYDVE
jgi:uncharacterized protein